MSLFAEAMFAAIMLKSQQYLYTMVRCAGCQKQLNSRNLVEFAFR